MDRSIDDVSADVLDVALRIHREIGPGLLETVYEVVLGAKLERMGYHVQRQISVPVQFEDVHFDGAFRADMIVDGRLLLEIKSVERLAPVHAKQLLTYLRLMKQPVGLLINFGGETLKESVKRVVNGHILSESSRLRVNQSSNPDRTNR